MIKYAIIVCDFKAKFFFCSFPEFWQETVPSISAPKSSKKIGQEAVANAVLILQVGITLYGAKPQSQYWPC